jgi:colanic acid/amylovoran biosynthesis glycosyltransferase
MVLKDMVRVKKGSNSKKPVIGIFRHTLLPPSETFIAEQAAHISNFEVHYFGREAGSGHFNLPNCHTIQGHSKNRLMQRTLYTITGRSKKLMQEMRVVSPILLHAHFGVEGVYALPFAQRLKIPLVTTFHGFDATRNMTGLLKAGKISYLRYVYGLKRLIREGDCFIAISNYIRNRLIERGFPPNKTIVHYIGIDISRFASDGREDDGRTILTVGRLVEKKGTEYLIRAIAKIRSEVPDVQLEIVGDGPLRRFLERLTTEFGISQQVRFIGTLSHEEVAVHMKKASIFCLPSVTAEDGDAEGLAIVFLEASASMKPVVGTLHGGIPEAIHNGHNGFLVPERDVNALSDRLLLLLKNPELRRGMGNAGRKMVEADFDINKQTHLLEGIYLEVIRKHQRDT